MLISPFTVTMSQNLNRGIPRGKEYIPTSEHKRRQKWSGLNIKAINRTIFFSVHPQHCSKCTRMMGPLGERQTKAAAVLYRRKAVKAACFLSNADKTLKRGLQFFSARKNTQNLLSTFLKILPNIHTKEWKGTEKGISCLENHCCLMTLQGSWTELLTWTSMYRSILCVL